MYSSNCTDPTATSWPKARVSAKPLLRHRYRARTYTAVASSYGSSTGTYALSLSGATGLVNPPADPDDQISEAKSVAVSAGIASTIDSSSDVDMYSISVSKGQYVGFDMEPGSGFKSYLRVFSYNPATNVATEVRTRNPAAPGESAGGNTGSYIEFKCTTTGTYYVGVSGLGDTSYRPVNSTAKARVLETTRSEQRASSIISARPPDSIRSKAACASAILAPRSNRKSMSV